MKFLQSIYALRILLLFYQDFGLLLKLGLIFAAAHATITCRHVRGTCWMSDDACSGDRPLPDFEIALTAVFGFVGGNGQYDFIEVLTT